MASLRGFGHGLLNAMEIAGAGPSGLIQRRQEANTARQDEMRLAEFISQHPQDYETVSKLAGPLKINLEKYRPSIDDLLAPERAKIEKDPYTTTPPQILRDLKTTGVDTSPVLGQTGRFPSGPSNDIMNVEGNGTLPSTQYGPTQRPPIQDLLNQRTENMASQDADIQRQLGITEKKSFAQGHGQLAGTEAAKHEAAPTNLADAVTAHQTLGPVDAANAGLTAGSTFDATHTPARIKAGAAEAGANAGASAAATFPFQEKLAQTRLTNQEALLNYRQQHPNLAPQAYQRATDAVNALDRVAAVRQQAEQLDKIGLMGPIAGILRDAQGSPNVAARLVGMVFNDKPDQARLAGEFVSSLGTLQTLIGMVHGGTRGGGSPQLLKHMQSLMNGATDLNFFNGELDGIEQLMTTYAKYPERYFSGTQFTLPADRLENQPAAGPQQNPLDVIMTRPPRRD